MHVQSAFLSLVLEFFWDSHYLSFCKGLVSKTDLCTIIVIYYYSTSNSREQNKHTHINKELEGRIKKKEIAKMMMMRMMRYYHHLASSENPSSQLAIIPNSREKYRQRWVAHEPAHQSEGMTTIIVIIIKQMGK
jgi:hypothetical protein